MTGKAQNTWRRPTQEAKAQYATAQSTLRKRFKPAVDGNFMQLNFKPGGVNKENRGRSWLTIYGYSPIKLSQT